MKSRKGKIFIVCGALVLVLVTMMVFSPKPPDPIYNGKHESEWFRDLCELHVSDINHPTPPEILAAIDAFEHAPKILAAVDAFEHAGPEFVPYLTNQLRYDRSGLLEKPLVALKAFGPTSKYFSAVTPPSYRRFMAVQALEWMRNRADSAIPALLEDWTKEKDPGIKKDAIDAVDSILSYVEPIEPGRLHPFRGRDRIRSDQEILEAALKRYPKAAVFFTNSVTKTN